eukprot:Skav206937  [mRNA]  locus=scaffold1247:130704:137612:+ [translate_table: standard]
MFYRQPCCTEGEDFYTEVGAVLVDTGNTHTRTPLVAPVITPEMRPPPGHWDAFPKDITRTVRVRTLTRNVPHAGSMGPIEALHSCAEEFAQMSSLGATCAVQVPLEFKVHRGRRAVARPRRKYPKDPKRKCGECRE